jgi:hypothetical protein
MQSIGLVEHGIGGHAIKEKRIERHAE